MRYRKSHHRRAPGSTGKGPRLVTWASVDQWASVIGNTWPTGKLLPPNEIIVIMASFAALLDLFPIGAQGVNLQVVTPQGADSAARALRNTSLERYRTATQRMGHSGNTVALFAGYAQSFMLGLAGLSTSPQQTLDLWTFFGSLILASLRTIEQRLPIAVLSAVDSTLLQANLIEINTTAGRMAIPSLGFPGVGYTFPPGTPGSFPGSAGAATGASYQGHPGPASGGGVAGLGGGYNTPNGQQNVGGLGGGLSSALDNPTVQSGINTAAQALITLL